MDGIKQEHERNERRLEALQAKVATATSPPPQTNHAQTGSNTRPTSSSSSRMSPADIASQLFSRNKNKSKSKSSGGKGGKTPTPPRIPNNPPPTTTTGSDSQTVEGLKRQVEATKENEMKLVSSAIGLSPDGNAVAPGGDDEVLDLADQLLAQLDAKEQGDAVPPLAKSTSPGPPASATHSAPIPIPAAGTASTSNTSIAQPQPMKPVNPSAVSPSPAPSSQLPPSSTASSSQLAPPASAGSTSQEGGSQPRRSSTSSSSRTGFGAKLKQALSPHSHSHSTSPDHSTSNSGGAPKKGRQQLRKEKKQAQEDAMRAEAQAEVDAERANGNPKIDAADVEKRDIDTVCRAWNLEVVEMEPDGHCMYSAVADQLVCHKIDKKANYQAVRKVAADYMKKNIDDFLPYLPAEDEEDQGEGLLSPEGYMKHCDNVANTSEWGSQTEVSSIDSVLFNFESECIGQL